MTATCLGYNRVGFRWEMCAKTVKTDGLCAKHHLASKRASARNLAKKGGR